MYHENGKLNEAGGSLPAMTGATTHIGLDLSSSLRPSMPIEKQCIVELDDDMSRCLFSLVEKNRANEPALFTNEHFGPRVHSGLHSNGPALFLADQSEIALFGEPEKELLEYRMIMLCDAGDMLVISHDRSEDFEAYLGDYLDIRDFDILIAADPPARASWPLPKRCLRNDELFQHIIQKTRNFGRLSIVPYMSTGHVWNLARRLAEETSAEIALAGPPPGLSRLINDKIWFSHQVKELLGQTALSPSFTVYGPAALAGHVKRLAYKTERLIIKIPNSAGSAGNLTFKASVFRNLSLNVIKAHLLEILTALGWINRFPLKVEIWETPVLVSPSAQIWVPHARDGPPVIEGLFEQVVEGVGGKFVGAIKSRMPAALQQMMAEQAMALATFFQNLGYFGRCSLDALVAGSDFDEASLHWIECNGRWGGVSVPMTLANRLLPDPDENHVVIVQKSELNLPGRPFQGAVNSLRDLLFKRGTSREGIVLLSPTTYEYGRGVHFMAIAQKLDRARELSRQAIARLIDS